ncbi:cysteine synthase A [Endozoicomonas elysicola]|uniref:Cysteine synthase n=1 Tax=Endozoicomonas elysicola TaxID=305900 RepID=A0A081KCC9_9GAMM|nr:cysteine synthase A [Endozoicomonas elysicola]KEI71805.1 cysteine synthase [Endozoicomonas elysicola]
MTQVYQDNSQAIGNTPLVKLNRLAKGHEIYVKIESRNPANSVKCRIGASMIWDAERSGKLKPGMELVEPTSGNTGIALAFVAASRGIPLTLTMPASMSIERRKVMKSLGANIVLTEPAKGMPGAIAKAKELAEENSEKYLLLQQFENPANPRIHEETTGPEIWNALNGNIDIFVAGVGTGGTISGVSRYIKEIQGRKITSVAVEPSASPVISQTLAGIEVKPAPHKIQGIGAGFIPANLDLRLVDQVEQVSNEDAIEMAHRLMREEGVLAGISGGAAVSAALKVAEQPENRGKAIVVILPDSGERYLSTVLFEGVFSENESVQ